jgi:hypothetical protein
VGFTTRIREAILADRFVEEFGHWLKDPIPDPSLP